MREYPDVASEHETVRRLLDGYSISRFGDGEIKIVCGAGYAREPPNPELAEEMRAILVGEGHPDTLVGIWSNDPRSPKHDNQERYRAKFMRVIQPERVDYYSSFISRPDSAPWIRNPEFALMLAALWAGKQVAVVCERKCKIFSTVRRHAAEIAHVECPHERAYRRIDQLEADVLALAPDIAILSAGPTATCLANRLAARGVQAIDLGSAGRWLGECLP